MRSNEKVKQFEEWLTEQKANGRLVPEQEPLIDAILSALPEETSSLAYLNHGNTISEPLVDAIITFIKREIEIFGRPQDPVQSMSQGCNYYSPFSGVQVGPNRSLGKIHENRGTTCPGSRSALKSYLW